MLLLFCGGAGLLFFTRVSQVEVLERQRAVDAMVARGAAEQARREAELAMQRLEKPARDALVVDDARVISEDETPSQRQIEISVRNTSPQRIVRTRFLWVLKLPDGRALAEGHLEHDEPDGFPSEAKTTWRIAPTVPSALDAIDDHEDATLQVDVIDAEFAE